MKTYSAVLGLALLGSAVCGRTSALDNLTTRTSGAARSSQIKVYSAQQGGLLWSTGWLRPMRSGRNN